MCVLPFLFVQRLASHHPIHISLSFASLSSHCQFFLPCMISLYLAIDHIFFSASAATVAFSFTAPTPTIYRGRNNASFNTHSCRWVVTLYKSAAPLSMVGLSAE